MHGNLALAIRHGFTQGLRKHAHADALNGRHVDITRRCHNVQFGLVASFLEPVPHVTRLRGGEQGTSGTDLQHLCVLFFLLFRGFHLCGIR